MTRETVLDHNILSLVFYINVMFDQAIPYIKETTDQKIFLLDILREDNSRIEMVRAAVLGLSPRLLYLVFYNLYICKLALRYSIQ